MISDKFSILFRLISFDESLDSWIGFHFFFGNKDVNKWRLSRLNEDRIFNRVHASSDCIVGINDGNIKIGNGAQPDGDADLRFTLRGPKGQADVHVDAQLTEGEWSMDPVDFRSAVR